MVSINKVKPVKLKSPRWRHTMWVQKLYLTAFHRWHHKWNRVVTGEVALNQWLCTGNFQLILIAAVWYMVELF